MRHSLRCGSRTTLRADDPWAVITRAVALGIAAEVHADRNMTSQDKARRPSKRPSEEPMRAGHYEEFFYDVHPHAHSLYARDVDGDEDQFGGSGHPRHLRVPRPHRLARTPGRASRGLHRPPGHRAVLA